MARGIKYIQMMWKPRGSHGPDVEMILYVPIAVAIESKPTVDVALKEIGQVIKYARSGMYDAVLVRLEKPPGANNAGLRTLMDIARQQGIGIVLGGGTHAPLIGSERVLIKALLELHGNPVLLYQKRKKMSIIYRNVDTVEEQLKDLSCFRRYFLRRGWGVMHEG